MRRIGFIAAAGLLLLTACQGTPSKGELQREIEAISTLRQLGLVEYQVRKIIKVDDQGAWYKIGDRKILLSCTAYLKAGIDLSSFNSDNVVANRATGTVTITLPHATLFSIDIPPAEIRHEYDQVTLLRSEFSAKDRNDLLQQGEKQILAGVPSLGILPKAEENARKFFESVFYRMGFSTVIVVFN